MKIILINGRGGVGKDTFVSLCQRMVEKNKILNVSTITPIKEAAKILGWDEVKDEKGRKFLSDLKDLSTKNYNLSEKYITKEIEKARELKAKVIFIHCREPEELGLFQELFNAKTLLIKNNRIKTIESNHADRCAENFFYDFTIDNNEGILELTKKAASFLEGIGVL